MKFPDADALQASLERQAREKVTTMQQACDTKWWGCPFGEPHYCELPCDHDGPHRCECDGELEEAT